MKEFILDILPGTPPITIATGENHIDIVKLLLANKAKVNKPSKRGTIALMVASGNNRLEIAKLLIENKANVNQEVICIDCSDKGMTQFLKRCNLKI